MSFQAALQLARDDDPDFDLALAAWLDLESRGELLVAAWQTGTPAARRAVAAALLHPFQRGTWQGFKRIWKLAEAAQDAATWVPLAATVDRWRGTTWPVSPRTLWYLQRRAYRHLKGLAHRHPGPFREHLTLLLPLYGADEQSPVLRRLLRLHKLDPAGAAAWAGFAPRLENPFQPGGADPRPPIELLELDDAKLLAPAPEPAAAPAGAAPEPPAKEKPFWPGPVFPEVWLEDPAWLVELLGRTRIAELAGPLARLVGERLGERALALPLALVYRLLEHPVPGVWRWALGQLAARARRELLRFEELAGLAERLVAPGQTVEWEVLGDLLWILDDERAAEARQPILPALRDLLSREAGAPGASGLADFLRRHAPPGKASALWSWATVLPLLGAARRPVRDLGGAVALRLADEELANQYELEGLLRSTWVEDAPDDVHRLLTTAAAAGQGYRPPGRWALAHLVPALERIPPAGFAALRRALLHFEEQGGLDASVGLRLCRSAEARVRTLGLELLGGALRRGALSPLELAGLLCETPGEEVAVWARERLEQEAAGGRLPNQALYRLLEAIPRDVRGFARELVARHLDRFAAAELIAFCAESPDATTAELGISLAETRLQGTGWDLRALLPMFRVLLYRVARDRKEKEKLLATLERWALADAAQARLAVGVVAAFRRSAARLEFTKAVALLAKVGRRYPEVELPFAVRETFGAGVGR